MVDDVMKEVDKLLKDREKFEGWLARLESEKSASSQKAYDRVRGDYDRRLQEILGKLRTHAQALEQRVNSLGSTLGELEGDHADRQEELDEARLRRSVGEFEDEKEWSKLEARLKSELEETEGQLASTNKEIGRLKEIVAQVSVAEPAAAVEPEPEPEPEPEQTESPAVELEVEPEPTAVTAPADEGHVSLGELVLEDEDFSGLDLEPAAAAKPEPAKTEPAAAEPEASGGDVGDELAFLESLSLGSSEKTESFSFLEDRGSGTPGTIICPHCSAANDPAEWYCTECGEELPAE